MRVKVVGRILWVVVVGLVVTVVGGVVTWRAVERLDDAHTRAATARNDMASVRAFLSARLDEAADRVGLESSASTDDEVLRDYLSGLAAVAEETGNDAGALVEDVLAREADLLEDTAADGAPDERLLFSLESGLRELERASVRAAADDADAAGAAARRTVVAAFALSAVLWSAAAVLARQASRAPGRLDT